MQQEIEVQGLRLSPQQKRLWGFQHEGAVSHSQAVVRLAGLFDGSRLRDALCKVVARHQSLRTGFYREPGVKVPFQVISDRDEIVWRCLDLQPLEDCRQQEAVDAELAAWRADSVEWEQGPWLRATWCVCSPEQSMLLLDIPALCADRSSLQNLVSEIGRWYGGSGVGEAAEDPVQYAQFSEWQNELLAEGEAETGRAWWAAQRLDTYPALTLPFERPADTAGFIFSPHSIQRDVPEAVVARLERVARDRKTTLEVLLYVCWQTWLARATRQRDLVCWWRCNGRQYEELQEGIGLFEKWVPVYGRLDPQLSVDDLLSRTVQAHAQAIEWMEYFSGETAGGQLNALTDPIGFEYESVQEPYRIGQGALALERSILSIEPFKLRLTCSQRDRALCLTWHYAPDRIPGESLQPLADEFIALLHSVTERVNDPIEMLDMVGTPERQRLIHTVNDTIRPSDGPIPLHALFEEQVRRQPDAPALVAGDRALTYAELNARANQVAHGLMGRGVKRGDCVGLCLERSAEMIIGLLGVLKAGAAYVPVDPAHAAVRLAPQMIQSGATIVLAQGELVRLWPGFDGTVLALDASSPVFSPESGMNPDLPLSPDHLAYVIYTSGSTGVPKGVAITHRNVVNYTRALCRQLDVQEPLHFATVSTLSADLGNTAIFPCLVSGGCLHVITYETATDGQLFSTYLAHHPIDVLKIVPSHFKALVATANGGHVFPRKYLVLGGERLAYELADQVARQAACTVINHYGPTETTIGALTCPVLQADVLRLSVNVPIGRPIDNLEAYILDERLDTVPVGVPGELYLGGEGVARGYLDQPDRTAERFVPHLHSLRPGARLYRTGDRARFWPDGRIEFLGRVDHQVKIRGFRIELGEIEAALARHPDVQDAVVTVHEDRHGEHNLAAYLVTRGPEVAGRAIQDFLRSRLPDYMIPPMITFLPAMPLTANGKVDRQALPEPDQGRNGGTVFVGPRTVTEEILAGLWGEVLNREAVGVQDNFFDLGGHSLLATQVMSRLRQAFRVELPLRTLFDAPSIAQLAVAVDGARILGSSDPSPAMRPVPRSGPIPLSFAQQRLWLLAQLEPDSVAYNIPIALRVLGPLDTEALQRSFDEVVRRHEVLRTTFTVSDGVPAQIIAPSLTVPLPVIDLQHLPLPDRQVAAERLAAAEAQRSFDLQYGPLLRINALRLNPDEHVLLLTLHHIVSDAWSAHVLVREVSTLYGAFVEGHRSPLPDLPIQYADFSQWQRDWLSGPVLDREMAYWKQILGGDLPLLPLPADHPRQAVQQSSGAALTVSFPSALTEDLLALSRREGVTLFMLLLTAFDVLLNRYTGMEDLLVGTPIANRNRKEIEGLIGFFVNTLVLRTDVSGNPTFKDLLHRVRDACFDAYAHQDVPFEKLVEILQPARDTSLSPLFQVMFDMQNAPTTEVEVLGLRFEPMETATSTSKFDLSLSMQEFDGHLTATMEYSTDLFEAATIDRMLRHFQVLLEGIVSDPGCRIGHLPLIPDSERQQWLSDWNGTGSRALPDEPVHRLFERQAGQTPDAIAVTCRERSLSYDALNCVANRIAHGLTTGLVSPESVVAVIGDRDIDLLAMMLATLKSGGVYLPLDHAYPDQRLRQIVSTGRVSVVLTLDKMVDRLTSVWEKVAEHERPRLVTMERLLQGSHPDSDLAMSPSSQQVAYIIYTSGSTGVPKGAMVEQRGLLNHLLSKIDILRLTHADVVAQTASQCFDISVWQFLAPLLCGGQVRIVPDETAHDPSCLLTALEDGGITVWETVPALLQGVLETAVRSTEAAPQLSRLRWVLPTGEAVPPKVCRQWFEQYPGIPLVNAYGPAECSDDVALFLLEHSPSADMIHVPIGQPIQNIQLYVLSPSLELAPVGVSGELCVSGAGVGRGYLNDPGRTAEVFIPNPFAETAGQRVYRTGDRARYLSNGTIEFLGRLDYQTKVRGFRIELGEIETNLSLHPNVRETVVMVREDSPGDRRLAAYVVFDQAPPASTGDLRAFLQNSLPEYMIPGTFTPLPALPRNSNGKVDRKALPKPEVSGSLALRYVAPRTPIEKRLAGIWAEVLGVQSVGIHDNFFDLGGHSMLAVQVMSRVRETMDGVRGQFPLIAVFQYPTVATLAETLIRPSEDASSPLVTLRAEGSNLPLYCVDPTGTHVRAYQPLAHALGDDQPMYGLSLSRLFAADWRDLSVAAIAKEHVELIRRCQSPGTPFHLLGWSNGGVIALAMAHELEQQGESVAFLGILDTQPQVEIYSRETLSGTEEMLAYIRSDRREDFLRIAEEERSGLQMHLHALPDDERVDYAIRWAKERDLLSEEEAHSSMEMLKVGYALDKAGAIFLREHTNQRLQAPVYAWWTTNTLQRHGKAPIDWSDYTTGTVTVDTVAGDHMEAVQSIQVHQRISEILSGLSTQHST